MSALHINDPSTVDLAERLADHAGVSRTQLVLDALEFYRDKKYPDLPPAASADAASLDTKKAQERELDRRLRSVTLNYTRLRAKNTGKPSGSRVYKMIADNGVVGTLEKLVDYPTDGLEFLMKAGREDLAAERIVLDPRFALVISAELRAKAERNLRRARAALGEQVPGLNSGGGAI